MKRKQAKSKKVGRRTSTAIVVALLILGSLIVVWQRRQQPVKSSAGSEIILNQQLLNTANKKGVVKQFSASQFQELYNQFAYPNTEYIAEDAVITGNQPVDEHIQRLAEKRGYLRRSAPVSNTFVNVGGDFTLQERASEPWLELKQAAGKEAVTLYLTAAYRSAADQRQIFLERLGPVQPQAVLNGMNDGKIDQVLAMTAIPGYSRHHTGYTIDIGCGNDPYSAFENTVCFDWLHKDNYRNAKSAGWIPSYPDGAAKQGPEPESWEYVWVGKDAVTE